MTRYSRTASSCQGLAGFALIDRERRHGRRTPHLLPARQLFDEPVDGPRHGGDVALGDVAGKSAAPLLVRRTELLDRGAAAAGQRQARGAEVVRVALSLGKPELLEPRDHPGHVLLR